MSKNENPTNTSLVVAPKAQVVTSTLKQYDAALNAIREVSSSAKDLKLVIASDNELTKLARACVGFAHIDSQFKHGAGSIGVMAKRMLGLHKTDVASFNRAMEFFCNERGIAYVEESTPHQTFARALFGPELMVKRPGEKDSRGSKRLSWYLMTAKEEFPGKPKQLTAGKAKGKSKGKTKDSTRPTSKYKTVDDFFIALYNAASRKDQRIIERLCVKIEYDFSAMFDEEGEE